MRGNQSTLRCGRRLMIVAAMAMSVAVAARADDVFVGPPAPPLDASAAERAMPLGPARPAGASTQGVAIAADGDSWVGRIGPVLLPLGVVIGLVVATAYVVRRAARMGGGLATAIGAGGRAPSGLLEVLGRYPVARGQSLVVIKLDRRVLLLSHASPCKGDGGGFTTLCQIDAPEDVAAILMKVNDADGEAASNQFEQALRAAEAPPHAARAGAWTITDEGRAVQPTRDGDRTELWRDDGEALTGAGGGGVQGAVQSLRERLAGLRGRAAGGTG